MNSPNFFDGVQVFLKAFSQVLARRDLRAWFVRALLRTVILALVLMVALGAAGVWLAGSWFEETWASAAAILIWILVLAFLSGNLAILLLNFFVPFVSGEEGLARLYLPAASDSAEVSRAKIWKDKGREYKSMLLGLALALVCWPLLLIPLLMPVGVCVFAWILAADALQVANRLCHLRGLETRQDLQGGRLPHSYRVGLGLVPAGLALVPLFGWVLLPLLQVGALEAQWLKKP